MSQIVLQTQFKGDTDSKHYGQTLQPTVWFMDQLVFMASTNWLSVLYALALKGVEFKYKAVELVTGQQHETAHSTMNPMKQVPVLQVGDAYLTQSLPIIEYLEETYPSPPLLPTNPLGRHKVRSLAEMINSGIQPMQNLSVIKYFAANTENADISAWPKHFITTGFQALEQALQPSAGKYCHGDEISLADVCLVPQVYNAMSRFNVDMTKFPTIARINTNLTSLPAFIDTHPLKQSDAPESGITPAGSLQGKL